MGKLFEELKRRKVFRIAALYAVVAWLIIQVAGEILPTFDAPQWVNQTIILVLILGFPLALVLAWVIELTPEGFKAVGRKLKKGSTKEAPFQSPILRWYMPQIIAVTLVMVVGVTVVTIASTRESNSLVFEPRDWVLITDFENETGDELFDRSLTTAFQVGLEQSTFVNVVPPNQIADTLARMQLEGVEIDEAVGLEISRREGIAGLVVPAISRVGDEFALAVRLVNPETGTAVRSYLEIASTKNEILSTLETLAISLRRELGESGREIARRSQPLPSVTTPSLEALDLYARGNQLWNEGRAFEGEILLQQALAFDPEFAMAHAALGRMYYSQRFNEYEQAQFSMNQALEYSEKTSERERLSIKATALRIEGREEEALIAYRTFLDIYPDISWMRFNMANLLMFEDRYEEAIEQYNIILDEDPEHVNALINLATTFIQIGRFGEATQAYQQAFMIRPELKIQSGLNHEFGFLLVLSGDKEQGRQIFERAINDEDIKAEGLRSLALLEQYLGHFSKAQDLFTEAAQVNQARGRSLSEARDRLMLAGLLTDLEQYDAALNELNHAHAMLDNLDAQPWMRERIGVLYARLGALNSANVVVTELERNQEFVMAQRSIMRVKGEIAIARGESDLGVNLFELVYEQSRSALTQESIAYAHRQAGDTQAAIKSYRDFLDRTDTLGWEAQRIWTAAQISLAEILRDSGDVEGALSVINRLVSLWSDAEDAPMVRRARQLQTDLDSAV